MLGGEILAKHCRRDQQQELPRIVLLLAEGEPYSRRAAAAHGGSPYVQLVANPILVRKDEIVATIARVMGKVHPLAITQEQILRAAFFAHLAPELGQTIGTVEAAVHPERPTPSCDYIFTGTRGIGMRARYDLGFGVAFCRLNEDERAA